MFKELIREVCLKNKPKRDDRSQNKKHSFKPKHGIYVTCFSCKLLLNSKKSLGFTLIQYRYHVQLGLKYVHVSANKVLLFLFLPKLNFLCAPFNE